MRFRLPATMLLFSMVLGKVFSLPSTPANELARKIIRNESKAEAADQSHWIFRLERKKPGKHELKEVVEAKSGDLERVLSVNGQPLAPKDKENQERILNAEVHNPSELRERQKNKIQDEERTQRMLRMLPDAFNFAYEEERGDLIKLKFTPKPNFHPPSTEARVFHAMEGEMLLNTREERLIEIQGHLTREVKFAGGLLGHLDRGGEFHVKQAEVAPGLWELTLLHVDMHGKALFFKSISVQQDEVRSHYKRVADDLTLADALNILHQEIASGQHP